MSFYLMQHVVKCWWQRLSDTGNLTYRSNLHTIINVSNKTSTYYLPPPTSSHDSITDRGQYIIATCTYWSDILTEKCWGKFMWAVISYKHFLCFVICISFFVTFLYQYYCRMLFSEFELQLWLHVVYLDRHIAYVHCRRI